MDTVIHWKRLVARAQKIRSQTQLRCAVLLLILFLFAFETTSSSTGLLHSSHTRLSSRTQGTKVLSRPFLHHYANGSAKHLRHLLENITLTQRNTSTPFVVILAVNYAYRNLAVNFVCNLIRLRVTNYLIFAMDQLVFDYFVFQKVNTFLHTEDEILRNKVGIGKEQDKEDVFGTRDFLETSLRKSVLVLEALKLGVSVVFSDVDVVWVQNPIQELLDKPEDIVIQSDRSSLEHDSPPNYKLNSGLYFVRSNPKTITAFRAIIKYARAIRRSEQKAFNYVLCGAFKNHQAGPGLRVGTKNCIYTPRGTTVSTLALESFPNGSEKKFWLSVKNFSEAHPDVVAIHANYVLSRMEKVQRIQNIGFWFYTEGVQKVHYCTLPS